MGSTPSKKPIIVIVDANGNTILDSNVYEGICALSEWNNPPKIFQIGRKLISIDKDDRKYTYKINEIKKDTLKLRLTEAANWITESTDEDDNGTCTIKQTITYPNTSIVGAIAEASQHWINIPYLQGLTNTPIPRPDGTINNEPGYDEETGYYFTPGLEVPSIPINPSKDDAKKAASYLLDELFSDFPIANDTSRANLLAALITPVLRPICGITPLFVITKPSPGEGASLLVDLISLVCTGSTAPVKDANTKNDDELRKSLFSLLRNGTAIANLDNLNQNSQFGSPVMAAFLTALNFNDRVLGQSNTVSYPNNICLFLTGRNVRLSGDIPRRSVLIEMNAMDNNLLQHPENRNFRHPNIKSWIRENRGKLVAAILTMLRAWIVAGKPSAPNTHIIGSFETWSEIISGILAYADITSFLDNRQKIYDEMDTEVNEWSVFVEAWNSDIILNGKYASARKILNQIKENQDLRDCIPSEMEKAVKEENTKSLGNILKSQRDVPLTNGLVIRAKKDRTKSMTYKVETIST